MRRKVEGVSLRRALKWLICGVLLILGSLSVAFAVGSYVWDQRADSAWADLEQRLDQEDPGWRWHEIEQQRRTIPDSENSAVTIVRIRERVGGREFLEFSRSIVAEPSMFAEIDSRVSSDSVEQLPMPEEWIEGNLTDVIVELELGQRLDPALRRELDRQLAGYSEAIALGRKLADQPFGRHPLHVTEDVLSTSLPTQQFARSVVLLMLLEAQRRADSGESSEAWLACRSAFNAARSVDDEPFLISLLIRLAGSRIALRHAERLLSLGPSDDEDLAAWRKLLEMELEDSRLARCIRGERAVVVKLSEAVLAKKVSLLESIRGEHLRASTLDDWLSRKMIRQSRPEVVQLLTRLIDVTRQPLHTWDENFAHWEDRVKHSKSLLTRLFLPSLIKVAQAEILHQAQLRVALVAMACEQFRRQHGRWPDPLMELVTARFLGHIPNDPYTGGPLRFATRPYGLQIWSVGPDRQDDDGMPLVPNRNGKGSSKSTFVGDVCFRLVDENGRGLMAERLSLPREIQPADQP